MSYRATLDCVASRIDIDRESSGKISITLACHNCDSRLLCRQVASKYADIINEREKISLGDRLLEVARSIGH